MSADISWIERGRKHLEIFIYINVPVRKNCQKKNSQLNLNSQIALYHLKFKSD